MSPKFFEARGKFLLHSQERFTDWGEADNYRRVGAALEEFHDLFALLCSFYDRLSWTTRRKPIWYRQEQLSHDSCDRFLGYSPYGRMFSRLRALEKGAP